MKKGVVLLILNAALVLLNIALAVYWGAKDSTMIVLPVSMTLVSLWGIAMSIDIIHMARDR